jgi:vacuolar-type H+-ATPase subunit I/STV1
MSVPDQQQAPLGADDRPEAYHPEPAGWVVGVTLFAATMMAVIGFFHVVQGLAALFQNQIYVTSTRYIFSFDLTTWGWIHLLVGVLLLVTGFAVTTGRVWARSVGIGFAVLSMITNFAFVPYYPVWSLLIIVIDVFVIWALCVFPRQDART